MQPPSAQSLPGINVDKFVQTFPAVLDIEVFDMAVKVCATPHLTLHPPIMPDTDLVCTDMRMHPASRIQFLALACAAHWPRCTQPRAPTAKHTETEHVRT